MIIKILKDDSHSNFIMIWYLNKITIDLYYLMWVMHIFIDLLACGCGLMPHKALGDSRVLYEAWDLTHMPINQLKYR